MFNVTRWTVILLSVILFLWPSAALSGSMDNAAEKADREIQTAGQKVDDSTTTARTAVDSGGKKTRSATRSGADKVGRFFGKTQSTVEGWMKKLEKKVKK